LLQTVVTSYNGAAPPITFPILRRTVTLQIPNSVGLQSKTDIFLNSLGLVTETDQYAYGSGAPGSLLRKTLITYNTSLTNHILDRPASVITQDGSANVIGETTYAYDETAVSQNSGTPPQHVAITGSRGNPTTVSTFSTGAASLSKQYSYYDTGTVNVATDVNGATTTYGYSSGSCGYSFPDSVTLPLSLSASTAYNCTGGVAISSTDPNGKISSANYASDAFFWRPNSVQDAAGALTSIVYTGQTQMESTMNFNGAISTADVLTTLDSQGRPLYRQTKQSPSANNYDSAQNVYDAVDALLKTTVPYVGTAGQPGPQGTPATTTNYDALGRPTLVTDGGGGTVTSTYTKNDVLQAIGPAPAGEHVKQKQLEYDALGRLTSVCEITGVTGSGACGQTLPQTGYLTTYTYDTTTVNSVLYNRTRVNQNAQPNGTAQTRTYLYDLLGRLVSETNPESGTTAYVYDSDAGGPCAGGTYLAGNLVKRTDAVTNVSCYSYDQLHRVLNITYPSGSYAASTPKKYFVYDAATVNSSAMVNAKGHLAEAYTCSGTCGSKITDLGFSYSARGEVSDVYQSTPHSGGYYHTTAGYWANGALDTLSGIPGRSTWTVAVDGEGRPYSATYGTTNWVKTTTYYPSNPQTTVTYGIGTTPDTDVYTFDANSGRMNQFKFTVGSTPVSLTGAVSWNPNGTLGSLGITDNFNASNTQNCTYAYDDLARANSVNCLNGSTTVWNQSFTLDPFGNISKSGTSSFSASYSAATNREQTVGSCSPTYDANGNLTKDCSFVTPYTYAWDAEGHATSLNGVTLTYDALGREAEFGSGSVFSQILYSPIGKIGVMNGQTPVVTRFPLPGGSTAQIVGASGSNYTVHADWLGTSRLTTALNNRNMFFDGAYAPFGESYAVAGTASGELDFTGQSQDTLTGLYDFLYREYNPVQGRWISPDPSGLSAVDPSNPQTWNRYAYVLNNPLSYTDLLGLDCVYLNDSGDSVQSIDQSSGNGECDANGGYWIEGAVNSPSWLTVNSDAGTVSGFGLDSNGDPEFSIAGAMDSNALGAWTQTFGTANTSGNSSAANNGGILNDVANWFRTAKFLGIGGSLWIAHPAIPVGWSPGANFVSDGKDIHGCLSLLAGGVGAKVPGGSVGLLFGDKSKAFAIIQGWSVTLNVNTPFYGLGVQIIASSAGTLAGPTIGTPGASLQAGYGGPCH